MFSRPNNFPFSPNFNFASNNLLGSQDNQNYQPVTPPAGGNFLLLDGSDFLLLDGTDFLLL